MRPISGWTLKELSPSSIESYLKCPFVFFANKGFRLLDMDEIDLDLDVRQSGQFYHAVADALLDPTRRLVWSEVELMELVEDLKNKHLIISETDPTWEPRKAKIVKWSQHFLDFEKDWLSTYPATQVFGRETSWKSPWGSDIVFRGKIDRLDINAEGQAVLIDYKSSTAGKAGPRSWLANNDLQLLFYIWALRSGGVSDFRGEIVGAFYYDLKKFDRSKGLHLRQESTLLASLVRKNAGVSPEELEEFMLEFEKKIDQTLFRMNQGCYQPEPDDQKDCQKCRWNQICRAPPSELKFQPDTNLLLRAGAGAGKTTTLIRLFFETVDHFRSTHKRWPRIVLTTFTRKATQEIRERLMKEALRREDPELFRLLQSRYYVQISTIHGVLSLFLSRSADKLGLPKDFQLVDEYSLLKHEKSVLKKRAREESDISGASGGV
ncbi:MAG: PD-(D/E)XK nuclease family protein [Bdellovibrionales bacterium]|nr:PD-(D/E)XK nuclease family protein [Bdellovibrionales bacterium]